MHICTNIITIPGFPFPPPFPSHSAFPYFAIKFYLFISYLLDAISSVFLSCSIAVCSLDCGRNGVCESGKCRCNPGWTGNLCDQLPCDTRCSEHGQCKNGTCVCSQGWNGRHCTLRKYILCLFIRDMELELKKQLWGRETFSNELVHILFNRNIANICN